MESEVTREFKEILLRSGYLQDHDNQNLAEDLFASLETLEDELSQNPQIELLDKYREQIEKIRRIIITVLIEVVHALVQKEASTHEVDCMLKNIAVVRRAHNKSDLLDIIHITLTNFNIINIDLRSEERS